MGKKKTQMPNSKAGLVRYYDDYQEAVQLDPKWIVGGVVGLIAIELIAQGISYDIILPGLI